MKSLILSFVVGAILLAAASAHAEPTAASMTPSVLRLFGALVLVVALAYAVMRLLRRLSATSRSAVTRKMHIMEILPLGPKAKLIMVKIGDQVVVVGAGDGSVNRIAEFAAGEFSADIDSAGEPAPLRARLLRLARK